MKKALIFRGGWDGHQPILVSNRFAGILERNGIQVDVFNGVECLADREKLLSYDLIVACMTMSELPHEYEQNICEAVAKGVGLAGCHGGMSHPGGDGIEYTVNICKGANPITEGIEDFQVCTEQYYLHVDPAVEVLATTRFPLVTYHHASNKPVDMPVAWTKFWGHGRVFYCSLGHHDDVFDKAPSAELLMERGMLWAAGGKIFAAEESSIAKI